MPDAEGQTFGISIVALDKDGKPAASARTAHSVFASWFFSNLSGSHPVTFTFAKGKLFSLRLLAADGGELWKSADPPEAEDYVVTIGAGGRFSIPITPAPATVPQQTPMIPLADIVKAQAIPVGTEIDVELVIPLSAGPNRNVVRLWRT